MHSWFVPEIINLIYCATKLEGRVCMVYFYPFVYLLIYFATKWAGVFAWLVRTYEIIKLIYSQCFFYCILLVQYSNLIAKYSSFRK